MNTETANKIIRIGVKILRLSEDFSNRKQHQIISEMLRTLAKATSDIENNDKASIKKNIAETTFWFQLLKGTDLIDNIQSDDLIEELTELSNLIK